MLEHLNKDESFRKTQDLKELPFKLIGVIFHDLLKEDEDISTGRYQAYVLKQIKKDKDQKADEKDENNEERKVGDDDQCANLVDQWFKFGPDGKVVSLKEKMVLRKTSQAQILLYERIYRVGPKR